MTGYVLDEEDWVPGMDGNLSRRRLVVMSPRTRLVSYAMGTEGTFSIGEWAVA